MAAAEVGDEQRGRDPTTRELEARVAELLGHDAAVFQAGRCATRSRSAFMRALGATRSFSIEFHIP
jgi:threonine aldolase